MKINFHPKSVSNAGGVLLCTMMVTIILGILLGSYLYLTQSEVVLVSRSQTWNTAMLAAEGGLEEGLSMINIYASSGTPLTSWPQATSASGWTSPQNNVYFLQRNISSNLYYQVYITNLDDKPVIKSVGYAYFPQTATYISRAIQTGNESGSFFLGAVLAKRNVSISGSMVFDSFNSQDANYSTGGQYDINKRKDGGNIGSILSNVVAAVSGSGNAKVYGKLATGPNSTISIGGNASAGSIAWVGGGNKGVQAGWSRNDLNVSIPDAPPPPNASYLSLPSPGTQVLNALGGTIYYRATSIYQMKSKNSLQITGGTVVIDAQAGIKMSGQASIEIASGSKLILYLGPGDTHLDGQGVVNDTGIAADCTIYGKNNCTSIEINGGAEFVGYLYAPYASITINGNSGIVGAMVGDTFQINGNMDFHYDESLGGPQEGSSIYRTTYWLEVRP